jgi:hypothetical protein
MNYQLPGRMKQMILFAACLLIGGPRLLGQGSLIFCNNSSTLVGNSVTSQPVTTTDGVKAVLYWSPVGTSNFVQIGPVTTVGTPLAGLFAAGTRLTGATTSGGATGQFQVRAWGGGYASYELAVQAGTGVLLGQSAVLQISTGNPTSVPPTPAASLLSGGLQSFTVTPAVAPTNLDIGLRVFDGYNTIKIAMQSGTPTSPLHISKGGTIYGVQLVSTNDPNASRVHLQTSTGVIAWKTLP